VLEKGHLLVGGKHPRNGGRGKKGKAARAFAGAVGHLRQRKGLNSDLGKKKKISPLREGSRLLGKGKPSEKKTMSSLGPPPRGGRGKVLSRRSRKETIGKIKTGRGYGTPGEHRLPQKKDLRSQTGKKKGKGLRREGEDSLGRVLQKRRRATPTAGCLYPFQKEDSGGREEICGGR